MSPKLVRPRGQFRGVPAEVFDGEGQRVAVGHAADVVDRGFDDRVVAGRRGPTPSSDGRAMNQSVNARNNSTTRSAWSTDVGPEVDAFEIERSERREGLGFGGPHADHAVVARWCRASTVMNASSCLERRVPTTSATAAGRSVGAHDAGAHRVFEVVADVRNAIGPRDYLALGRRRRRPVPAVVADGVEGLLAQVEWSEHDVGAVDGVVIPARQIRRQRVLRRVTGGAVTAVVAERGGFGQRDIQPGGPCDAHRNLRDLDGVREAVAQVIVVGRDEHLAFSGEATEGV